MLSIALCFALGLLYLCHTLGAVIFFGLFLSFFPWNIALIPFFGVMSVI